jgi:hypothetical protein
MPESEEEAMASDVDALAATLDERYGMDGWAMWRAAIGGWVVKLESDKSTHSRGTISLALQGAVNHKPLPVVPRRPSLFSADGADVYKSGSTWRVAEEWAKLHEKHIQQAYDDWMTNHGWTLGKQEGVDFRYE